jgi:arsenate reductase (glutaredoxin)
VRPMIQIFGTSKCKTTRKAQRFFAERRIRVQQVELRERGLSRGELESVARSAGGLRALLDVDGKRWADRGPHHSVPSDARLLDLFLEDPLLLRTPIVRDGPKAAVGAAEDVWRTLAEDAKAP